MLFGVFIGNNCHRCAECTTDEAGRVFGFDLFKTAGSLCLRFILPIMFDLFEPKCIYNYSVPSSDWRMFVVVWIMLMVSESHCGLIST